MPPVGRKVESDENIGACVRYMLTFFFLFLFVAAGPVYGASHHSRDPLYQLLKVASAGKSVYKPKSRARQTAKKKTARKSPITSVKSGKASDQGKKFRLKTAKKPSPILTPLQLETLIAAVTAEPTGFYGVRLSDLESGGVGPQGINLLAVPVSAGSEAADENGDNSESADDSVLPPLKEADHSLTRKEDGAIRLVDAGPLDLVGFYGYGGVMKGKGYQFTGTGFAGAEGTSRVIPVALTLAGITPDPTQNIYSAEMRAELPIQVGTGVKVVSFAGYRAVRTDTSAMGLVSELGGSAAVTSEMRSLQQVPVGIGMRLLHEPDSKTAVQVNTSIGAVASMGDTGTVEEDGSIRVKGGRTFSGIGSVGLQLRRKLWNFGVGADIGVTEGGKSETGLSVNVKRSF